MIQWLKDRLNGDRFQVIAIVICIIITLLMVSCVSKVESLFTPQKKVSRGELDAEVAYYKALVIARYKQLDAMDATRKAVLDELSLLSKQGNLNYGGVITTALSILGIGAVVDNAKYRSKNKSLSNQTQPSGQTTPPVSG